MIAKIATEIKESENIYHIKPHIKNAIILTPIVIVLLQTILWLYPATRYLSIWMLKENSPVELLTFMLLFVDGVVGLLFAAKIKECGEEKLVYGFYALFSIGLLFVALEEIAWGQWLFGFETPEIWKSINRQKETTLHNLAGLQGHSEIMRLIFGAGGLIGILLSFHPVFRKVGAPALLLSWFAVIALHASIDVLNDFVAIQKRFDYAIMKTSELIELLIAISAFLYIRLNARRWSSR
ncbi:MAG: hypothetical protein ACL93V_03490 [Candidatus Electrothrix sp. YB6]